MFAVSLKKLLFIFQQGPMLNTESCNELIVVLYGTHCSEPHHSHSFINTILNLTQHNTFVLNFCTIEPQRSRPS